MSPAKNRRRTSFLKPRAAWVLPPQYCRAYEDTDLGLEAIRAAGMEAVDVRPLLATN